MDIIDQIRTATCQVLQDSYQYSMDAKDIQVNLTKPEFEGDYTVVLFSFIKQLKKSPEQLGNELGKYLTENNSSLFTAYNVIKGFLNLAVADNYWIQILQTNYNDEKFCTKSSN